MDCDNLAAKITDSINQLNEDYFFFEMKRAAQVRFHSWLNKLDFINKLVILLEIIYFQLF